MLTKILPILTCAWAALAVCAAPAQSQALGRLLACADIPRAEERLQCYDAAARVAIGLSAPSAPLPAASLAALKERERDLEVRELRLRMRELEIAKQAKPSAEIAPKPPAPAPKSATEPKPADSTNAQTEVQP